MEINNSTSNMQHIQQLNLHDLNDEIEIEIESLLRSLSNEHTSYNEGRNFP
jgi:hypothetical protein